MTQSNTDNRIKFGLDKAVLGMLLTLAWPTILENLLETILQYVDTAMVGHLGAQATATVSLTSTYTWLIQSVIGALGVGFLSYIARAVGEKDQSKIRKASRLAMIVALLAGGILMAITLWMAPHVPVWMGAEKAIHADATRYFIFINLPMIFRAATIIFASAIRATGDTKTPMIVNVWVNVINIGLNYVFIYLLGKGAVGAGMATMVSYTIGGLLMTVVFLHNPRLDVLGKGGSPAQGKEGKPLVIEKAQDILPVTTRQVLTAVLAISLPVVLTRLASCLGHVVFTSFVSSMDTITYAAHAIAITAEEIFYIPGYGMMAATSTLIGHAIGEKNKKRRIKRKYSHAFLRSLRVREIESMGEIGIKGEPALTVFLSGVLGIITETLLEIIIVMFDGEKKTSSFFPCLSRNTFILNFTGIFSLTPAKLLNEVIRCHKEEE